MGVEVMALAKPDKIDHPVLERLEELRVRMGMSREKFANAVIGVSYPTYHRWLKGEFRKISLERLEQLEQLIERLESELSRATSASEQSQGKQKALEKLQTWLKERQSQGKD